MSKNAFSRGDTALSLKGRDKGNYFIIIDSENGFAWVADGKVRKATKPKKKNVKHLKKISSASFIEIAERINKGEPIADKKIKKAITALNEKI